MHSKQSSPPNTNLNASVVAKAAEWVALIWSGEATADEQRACQRWRASSAAHDLAFKRLESIGTCIQATPQPILRDTLLAAPATRKTRRQLLGLSGLLLAGGATWGLLQRTAPGQRLLADLSTPVGQWRNVILPDGSRLVLNTGSAIDLAYSQHERRIILRHGEIYLESAPDTAQPSRPLMIESRDGLAIARGTRYSVRQDEQDSHVAVYDGTVEIRTQSGTTAYLQAGESTRFNQLAIVQPYRSTSEHDIAWTRGRIIANARRLDDFIQELSSYRTGYLGLDPALADLRMTGGFNLDDTDFILDALEQALPVRVHRTTRYWVRITPR